MRQSQDAGTEVLAYHDPYLLMQKMLNFEYEYNFVHFNLRISGMHLQRVHVVHPQEGRRLQIEIAQISTAPITTPAQTKHPEPFPMGTRLG